MTNTKQYSHSKSLDIKINNEHYEFFTKNIRDRNDEALYALKECIVDKSSFNEALALDDIYSILLMKACHTSKKSVVKWILNQPHEDNILINSDKDGYTLLVKILALAEYENEEDHDPDTYTWLRSYIEEIQDSDKYRSGQFLGSFYNITLGKSAEAAQYPDFGYTIESYISTFFEPLYQDEDIQTLRKEIGEDKIASYYV